MNALLDKEHFQGDWINWINCVKGTEITVIQLLDIYWQIIGKPIITMQPTKEIPDIRRKKMARRFQ